MSRNRIIAKLRKNHCFQKTTALLEEMSLRYEVCPPTGKGHPFILIENPNGGDPIRHHMACTPKTYKSGDRAVSELIKKLEAAGLA